MPSLATFRDLRCRDHTLGLFCVSCNRWGEADLDRLIATGNGDRLLAGTRFRCKDCGAPAEKQVRPPVPTVSRAEAYIRAG